MNNTTTREDSPELVGRKIPFEFPSEINPQWIPGDVELSSMLNGGSLTMPYLEPFLIRTIREAGKQINDPRLKSDVAGFASQEGHHFRAHRQFNDLLTEGNYPELRELEQHMQESYHRLGKKSLQTRMAYTAGFEAMTMGVTKWIIGRRVQLFAGADPRVTSFILWHMVEETEHKRVAHDVYADLYGSSLSAYLKRAVGVFHGSFGVMHFSMQGYKRILKKDALWYDIGSRLRLWRRLGQMVWHVFPFLFRAALPGHDPRREEDLQWVVDWLEGYDKHPEVAVPLVDTNNPEMPVPFGTLAGASS